MNTLGSLKDTGRDFQRPDAGQGRRSLATIVVIACLSLATILIAGYFLIFRQAKPERAAQDVPASISTEAQVFEDEIIVKDTHVVVGGKVRNISRAPLKGLSLEYELKRRADGNVETRAIKVEPDDLAPGEEGKFVFNLPRQEFSGTQIKHLKSEERSTFIAFKTAQGARRPRELPPEPPTRTVIIERPAPKKSGDDFINTPDTPTKVP
jgi:Na+-transporting NADH:ubiquinone oxidoreductase subunit NqrC